MKKKIYLYGIVTLVLILAWSINYKNLNAKYPNPTEHIAHLGEKLEKDGYSFCIKSWEWYDGSVVDEILPDYTLLLDTDGKKYPAEKEKIALTVLEICKLDDTEGSFDVTEIKFEMGAWRNQWDIELYEALNGTGKLYLDLEENERIEITFPIAMYEFQFDSKTWDSIEDNTVSMVIGCYPEKYILLSK